MQLPKTPVLKKTLLVVLLTAGCQTIERGPQNPRPKDAKTRAIIGLQVSECLRRVAVLEDKVALMETHRALERATPNDSAVEVQDWPQGETSHNGSSDIDYD